MKGWGQKMKRAIMMNRDDTVATALENLEADDAVRIVSASQEVVEEITVRQAIPFGHKLALRPVAQGEAVSKYGEVIGKASQDITPGDYVHVHNVKSNRMQLPEIWYRK
jgi:altronate dehydratase small subunit